VPQLACRQSRLLSDFVAPAPNEAESRAPRQGNPENVGAMKPPAARVSRQRPLSRRRFLLNGSAVGTAVVTSVLAGSGRAGKSAMATDGHAGSPHGVPRAPFDKDALLVEPEVRHSVNGELHTTLRVGYAYKEMGGYRLSLRTYEGNLPARHCAFGQATPSASGWSTICRPTPIRGRTA
jgi:hypothetical protein